MTRGLRRVGTTAVAASEHFARRRPLAASVAVVGVLIAAFFSCWTPSYQTNDDVWLAMIAAGKGISLAPDEHLIFSNVVVGQVLRSLYTEFPSAPWYAWHLYLVQALAHVALLFCAISSGHTRRGLLLYLAYFATVGVYLLNNLQFTSTALLAVQGGAALCLAALLHRGEQPSARIVGRLSCGVLLMVWGALVRIDAYVLVLICGAAPAYVALASGASRATVRPAVWWLVASLGLVAGFSAYNSLYYSRDPRWCDFYEYNELRVKFNDYGWTDYSPATGAAFDAAGWSENDHAMIAHWYFDDPDRYGVQQLRQVLAGQNWRVQRLSVTYFRGALRELLRDKTVWIIVLAMPAFLWSIRGVRRAIAAVCAAAAAAVVVVALLAILTKPPPSRVYVPILALPLCVALVCSGSARVNGTSPSRAVALPVGQAAPPRAVREARLQHALKLATTALALVAVGMGVSRQLRQSARALAAQRELTQYVRDLAPREDQLYVAWASSFPFEAISPSDDLSSFESFRLLALSWPQTTPIARDIKLAFEIDDLARALFERGDVRLIAEEPLLPLYATYVREHYGQTVEVAGSESSRARPAVVMRRHDQNGRRTAAREPRILPPVSWRVVR